MTTTAPDPAVLDGFTDDEVRFLRADAICLIAAADQLPGADLDNAFTSTSPETLPPGLYLSDPHGHALLAGEQRKLTFAAMGGCVDIGGIAVTDPLTLERLADRLYDLAGRLRKRTGEIQLRAGDLALRHVGRIVQADVDDEGGIYTVHGQLIWVTVSEDEVRLGICERPDSGAHDWALGHDDLITIEA